MTRARHHPVARAATAAAAFFPALLAGAAASQDFGVPEGDRPVTLEAGESMAWDRRAGTVTASGGARLAYGELVVTAERLTGYRTDAAGEDAQTGEPRELTRVVGEGDLVAVAPPLTVRGASGEVDLTAYRAVVRGAPARFEMVPADGATPVTGWANERLVYDGPALTLTLTGGAHIARQPYALRGETITARFDPVQGAQAANETGGWPPAPGDLARAEATGEVELAGPEGTVEGRRGIYDRRAQRVAVIGDVILTRGGNTVTGDAALLDLEAERATVTGRGDRRVRAVVEPGQAPPGGEE